jgi:DNA-binding NtrC family response regulator
MLEAVTAAETMPEAMAQPVRVLIADAKGSERAVLREFLGACEGPIDITESEDAAETLAILSRGAIDVAFVDIVLHGDTGINVVDEAQRRGVKPFLVMTAGTVLPNWAMVATNALAYEFLKKPYAIEDIANAVKAFRRMKRPTRILLADGSAHGRNIVRKILQSSQFACEVHETDNGREALKMGRQLDYELALVDIGLSGMSGLEAACQLKSRFPATAVALMMPQTDTMLANCLKHFGLDHALMKPFFGRDVDLMMHKVHGLRRPYLMNAIVRASKQALAS